MSKKRLGALAFASIALVSLVGCSGEPLTTREKGTMIGAGAGAVGGAVVGSAVGAPLAGAAIGGVGGAAVGYGVGNHIQNEQDRRYYGE
jgi:Glycine zipper